MKAILEFNLPDESYEHDNAVNGYLWRRLVCEIDKQCREWIKYGCPHTSARDAIEAVRGMIAEGAPEMP